MCRHVDIHPPAPLTCRGVCVSPWQPEALTAVLPPTPEQEPERHHEPGVRPAGRQRHIVLQQAGAPAGFQQNPGGGGECGPRPPQTPAWDLAVTARPVPPGTLPSSEARGAMPGEQERRTPTGASQVPGACRCRKGAERAQARI